MQAFVAGFTIFKHDVGTTTTANISAQGMEKVVIYGIPDWVYEGIVIFSYHMYSDHVIVEEVLATNYAMWWAPDGEHILYAAFNDSVVRDFNFPFYGEYDNVYTDIVSIAYPKVTDLVHPVELFYLCQTGRYSQPYSVIGDQWPQWW